MLWPAIYGVTFALGLVEAILFSFREFAESEEALFGSWEAKSATSSRSFFPAGDWPLDFNLIFAYEHISSFDSVSLSAERLLDIYFDTNDRPPKLFFFDTVCFM